MGAAPLKIVLVGDPGVGKSSLFVRWSTGSFSPDSKQHWDPYVTELKRGRRKFRVTLWDTGNLKRLETMHAWDSIE